MPTATTFAERRRAVRIRTFIGAKAIFNQRQSTLDCMVRNQSDDGALLVFPGSVALPELFELYLPLKRESRMVRSRWRDGERIGVSFTPATKQDDAPIPLDLVRRLRQLEQENAALKARIATLTEGA
jgi:uncharacterized protein YceH (UPF0502 family)